MSEQRLDAERLATVEQIVREVKGDVKDLREEQKADHHRLRSVEQSVMRLLENERDAREGVLDRQRRIELLLKALTSVVALAAVVEPLLFHFAHN
jgi:hypothetical protein